MSLADGLRASPRLRARLVHEQSVLETSRPRLARTLRWLWAHPAVVLLPLATLVSGAAGFMHVDGDQLRFRTAGAAMLGPEFLSTFRDSWLQVGPVYLLALGSWTRFCQTFGLPEVAVSTSSAALQGLVIAWLALVASAGAAASRGTRALQAQWVVGGVVVLGGLLNGAMFADHPEELLLGLVVALAAVEVDRGRPFRAAALLGLGTTVKMWVPVSTGLLFHGRRWRSAVRACLLVEVIVALAYIPFFAWGKVSTFDLQWDIPVGTWYAQLTRSASAVGWSFRTLQALASAVAGLAVALRRRGSPLTAVVVAVAARLLLDPIRLSYYWTALAAVLLVWLWSRETSLVRRSRLAITLLLPPWTLSASLLPTPFWWYIGTALCVAVMAFCMVADRDDSAPNAQSRPMRVQSAPDAVLTGEP